MFSICLYKFFVIYKKIIPVILRDVASHQIPITKIRGSLKIKGEMKNSKQETSLCTFIDASKRKRETESVRADRCTHIDEQRCSIAS